MINQVKLIFLFCIVFSGSAIAANTELSKSPENCKRVSSMSNQLAEMISQTLKVRVSSITFLRGEHGTGPYGSCAVVVDTPIGIKRCSYLWILDNGDGKPFAATMTGPGNVPCE